MFSEQTCDAYIDNEPVTSDVRQPIEATYHGIGQGYTCILQADNLYVSVKLADAINHLDCLHTLHIGFITRICAKFETCRLEFVWQKKIYIWWTKTEYR